MSRDILTSALPVFPLVAETGGLVLDDLKAKNTTHL